MSLLLFSVPGAKCGKASLFLSFFLLSPFLVSVDGIPKRRETLFMSTVSEVDRYCCLSHTLIFFFLSLSRFLSVLKKEEREKVFEVTSIMSEPE